MPAYLPKLVNTSGSEVEALDHREVHIHNGIRFAVSDYDASVAETSGAEKIWRITTPNSAVRAHFEFDVGVDNEALIELRENPTIISAGTALYVYNKNRNSTISAVVLAYKDAGITYNTGSTVVYLKTGSAGQKEHTAGDGFSGNWLLKVNEDYVVIVFPVNAATGASVILKWDEE